MHWLTFNYNILCTQSVLHVPLLVQMFISLVEKCSWGCWKFWRHLNQIILHASNFVEKFIHKVLPTFCPSWLCYKVLSSVFMLGLCKYISGKQLHMINNCNFLWIKAPKSGIHLVPQLKVWGGAVCDAFSVLYILQPCLSLLGWVFSTTSGV